MGKMPSIQHLIGTRFGRLIIIEDAGQHKMLRRCMVKCDCGGIKNIRLSDVVNGIVKSCGCLNDEVRASGNNRRTHGLVKHPLFAVWQQIKKRCYKPTHKFYNNYGALGVTMCDEWKNDFKSFYDWAISNGWKKGLDIDKDKLSPIRPGRLYSPASCSILTRKENSQFKKTSLSYRTGDKKISYESTGNSNQNVH